mmetsp:Transcript_92085/g.269439  ORF Transcript_92085/g.269439 Transcript_92085/m.269439 type:complete len:205 (+) Transcript_92085:703-1317(+)
MHPCSNMAATVECSCIADRIRWSPPHSAISLRPSSMRQQDRIAQQASSWTRKSEGCCSMAMMTARRAPWSTSANRWSAASQAWLPRAAQACSCRWSAAGWAYIAETMASTPPQTAMRCLRLASSASSSKRMQDTSCKDWSAVALRIRSTMASTSSDMSGGKGRRESGCGLSSRPQAQVMSAHRLDDVPDSAGAAIVGHNGLGLA